MNLRRRLNSLDGGEEECPVCDGSGLPRDFEIKMVVRRVAVDPETGRALPKEQQPKREPRYCPGCGHEIPVIRVKGLQDKPIYDEDWKPKIEEERKG